VPEHFSASLDTRAQDRFLARYSSANVDKAMTAAGLRGATAARAVLKERAYTGKSLRPSQYYRRMKLEHGTLKASVRAAKIKGRGSALGGLQGRTIGWVIGPIGKNAFTRHWVEKGFQHAGKGGKRVEGHPWVEEAASETLEVANHVADSLMSAYARESAL
jgi:hypothetical protein